MTKLSGLHDNGDLQTTNGNIGHNNLHDSIPSVVQHPSNNSSPSPHMRPAPPAGPTYHDSVTPAYGHSYTPSAINGNSNTSNMNGYAVDSRNPLKVNVQVENTSQENGHIPSSSSKDSLTDYNNSNYIEGYNSNGPPLYQNGKPSKSTEPLIEGAVEYSDSSDCREMAIDVPENFEGTVKQRPSYPSLKSRDSYVPPQPSNPAPSIQINNPGGESSTDAGFMGSQELTRDDISKEQLERIRMHQESLRKRKEEEDKYTREQNFLRESLRGSKKMQALSEQGRPPVPTSGFVNTAYLEEDENKDVQYEGATLQVRGKPPPGAQKPLDITDLYRSLGRVQSQVQSTEYQEKLTAIQRLLETQRFQRALAAHNKIVEVVSKTPPTTALGANSQELVGSALIELDEYTGPQTDELMNILQNANVQSLMLAHDQIAQRASLPPTLTADDIVLERASQYGEDNIKIIRLQKTTDPLGATVRNDGESVIIGRIVKGGAADKSGLLHEGDEILEINGEDMRGKTVNDVFDFMANLTGTLTFLIVPNPDNTLLMPRTQEPPRVGTEMHIKAHYGYDPEDDLYIPCRELGISFEKGDILHVINQEDANWWQAYREGEEDQALAGLIPSKNFQEQRESLKQDLMQQEEKQRKKKKRICAGKGKKKKKKMYNSGGNDDLESEEILSYEEVALYYPEPNRKRPVVLIGPPNVGRHELRQRLMESDIDRFAAAVPHTSRPRKSGEGNGKDYHFVPRHQFEQEIVQNKFVEHGEYEKNLYGTSLMAIREVVSAGKICVLNLHPQSLKILKVSDLKPYVVFVAPPNLEKLRRNREAAGDKVSMDELKEIIEKAREMEDNFGHYFDLFIVNYDMDKAFDELVSNINRLEVEPQWVPAQWVQS
ncbi:unnamed protein product [Owenia fusiformis]|nr:unnamed protein product [Owenia fusiformis]